MASIKDVAKRAGVSISTVSRYINRSAFVEENKAEAIREAMAFYRYQPSQFGRGLVKQKTNLIGVYLAYFYESIFDSDYNVELIKGIERALKDTEYSMVILGERTYFGSGKDDLPRYMEYVRQKRIDGLILSGISDLIIRRKTFGEIMETGFPMVYVGQRVHEKGMNVYAQFDSYRAQMAIELYGLGHRKILMFMLDMHARYLQLVREKILAEIPDADVRIVLLEMENIHGKTVQIMEEQVLREGITAVIAPTMESVAAVYGWCSEHNISIPEQLSVMAVESRKGEGETFYPPVSVFCTQTKEMGEGAANLVMQAIGDPSMTSASIEYPAIYIPRESVRALN